MDQHPIPQDVTGFQFKLIGTMTVKQFGFVASGVVMAVILYYLPLKTPLSLLIKLIFIPLLGAGGAIIAFVPIDGRPIDVMTGNFMKALFSPNQYIYHRTGKAFSFSKIADAKVLSPKAVAAASTKAEAPTTHTSTHDSDNKEEKLRVLLMGTNHGAQNDLDKKEAAFLSTIGLPSKPTVQTTSTPSPFRPSPLPLNAAVKPVAPLIATPAPMPSVQPAPVQLPPDQQKETPATLTEKENELEKELTLAKQQELQVTPPQEHLAAQQKVGQIETQIQQIHEQKQTLEQELSKLQSQLHQEKNATPSPILPPAPVMSQPAITAPTPQPTPAPQENKPQEASPLQDPSHVRTIPQEITKKAGLPHVSDTPNVVVGIVKDPRGNVLSNILVEVKDREGNPARAFKTNALGQFASATPLSSGTYTMELEDPKKMHRFDVIQVTANNQIMLPIEVISHDAREELRQQLFAQ